jgi:hypothetical protein
MNAESGVVSADGSHPGNGCTPAAPPAKKRYWLTPPDLYAKLDAEFHFDFDPCPHPVPEDFDGLLLPWGRRNWVNPPFNGRMAIWSRKAIWEARLGKLVVMIWPTYLGHEIERLGNAGAEIRYVGRVPWVAIEDGSTNPGAGPPCLLFILREAQW